MPHLNHRATSRLYAERKRMPEFWPFRSISGALADHQQENRFQKGTLARRVTPESMILGLTTATGVNGNCDHVRILHATPSVLRRPAIPYRRQVSSFGIALRVDFRVGPSCGHTRDETTASCERLGWMWDSALVGSR